LGGDKKASRTRGGTSSKQQPQITNQEKEEKPAINKGKDGYNDIHENHHDKEEPNQVEMKGKGETALEVKPEEVKIDVKAEADVKQNYQSNDPLKKEE